MEHTAPTARTKDDDLKRRRELEITILEKVGDVITSINDAKHVDQVICALHSLAVLLFPIDSHALSGSIDRQYREQILRAKAPSDTERNNSWRAFYDGGAFPTLVRVLLCDVASNWLACFPFSAKKLVYDVFFVNGLATEVVQTVVHFLQRNESDTFDVNAICTNAERLLILHLIESDGVRQMAREFDGHCQHRDASNEQLKITISRMAQLVTSIPDKARLEAPDSLASHIQFLAGAEDCDKNLNDKAAIFNKNDMDGTILFVGESLARICRRGAADVLVSEMIPRILRHVQSFLLKNSGLTVGEDFGSKPGFRYWLKMIEAIKDTYAIERMSEQLLHQLVAENASDVEAYWVLWVLFHQMYEHQTSIRFMFVDKFLLWKVFPVRCLRWILQFAVLGCLPDATSLTSAHNTQHLRDTVQRLLATWSKREFVQSASMEQQTYITAALGLSLEKMSKEDLDATKDAMHSILQGVSCRLESPAPLVRRMASNIALVFSKVIDPKNPLYLDDSCREETIDWEFGLATDERVDLVTAHNKESESNKVKACSSMLPEQEFSSRTHNGVDNNARNRKKKLSDFKLIDPDEIIDPATLNDESVSGEEEDDDASQTSETSSDSSLQPYDLSDDDSDLKRKLSQLVDVVGALRKSDDADGVERALDVAEKLVRASPDELRYVASDLVRTLIQVRCYDSTTDGEEESAEEKRQKALVALITKSPFESLDNLNKLLYAPTVDVSQRIMILDVMTDAAEELANARTIKVRHQPRVLISTTSETQPWFMPSSTGPPGAGSWKEISGTGTGTLLNWSYSYERELPPKPSQIKKGKTRRWSLRSANVQENQMELSQNGFPQYAAAFMLPAMQGFDKKRHGVDLLGRDFIVLGKLIYMLGVCMKCAALHPEASALALPLMDMLSSREICHHVEAYVRRSVLFAASCILVALNPSYIASALVEGNSEFSKGLEWIRTWALHVAESDTDRECYTMAMTCLQLHAEMALQASRAIESAESTISAKSIGLPSNLLKGSIKIPYLSMKW